MLLDGEGDALCCWMVKAMRGWCFGVVIPGHQITRQSVRDVRCAAVFLKLLCAVAEPAPAHHRGLQSKANAHGTKAGQLTNDAQSGTPHAHLMR